MARYLCGVTPVTPDDLLSPKEAAAILSIHPVTLSRWADDGRIAHQLTPTNRRRFRRRDVEALAERMNVEATP